MTHFQYHSSRNHDIYVHKKSNFKGQLVQTIQSKQEIYAQRAQTSADPEDPDFGLWTPGSEA